MPRLDAIDTERLRLTHPSANDLGDLCRLHSDAQVMATLGGVRGEAASREVLRQMLAHWDAHGFGLWLARELRTQRFVGRGGLRRITIAGTDEIEVAYALMPQFWGMGLATELAAESIRVGFDCLGFPELVCFTLPTNHRSRRVMERVGFTHESDVDWKGRRHVLYRLRAAGRRRAGPRQQR